MVIVGELQVEKTKVITRSLTVIISIVVLSIASFSFLKETPVSAQVDHLAVIIGVADYAAIGDLSYADDDAVAIYYTLIHYGWPSQDIQLLVSPNPLIGDEDFQWGGDRPEGFPERLPWPTPFNASPTRDNILAALDWLKATSENQTTVLIYFSGHGGQVSDLSGDETDGLDETICPTDTGVGGITDITDDEFLVHIAGIRGNVTVMLDSCHSGGFAGRNDAMIFRPSPNDQPQDIAGYVSVVLAGSHAAETPPPPPPEPDFDRTHECEWQDLRRLPLPSLELAHNWRDAPYMGHGWFTDWLLIGMNCIVAMSPGGLPIVAADCPPGLRESLPGTGNGDGYVSAEELFHFIRNPLNLGESVDPAGSFSDFLAEALHTQYGNALGRDNTYAAQHPELWDRNEADDVILIDMELAYV